MKTEEICVPEFERDTRACFRPARYYSMIRKPLSRREICLYEIRALKTYGLCGGYSGRIVLPNRSAKHIAIDAIATSNGGPMQDDLQFNPIESRVHSKSAAGGSRLAARISSVAVPPSYPAPSQAKANREAHTEASSSSWFWAMFCCSY
ncbi:hypothetical protein PAPHI01_0753 [Pancytospora philotis]|nr:hypothetical protein PAPHI01_0753 [Pancytospora philotis]